MKLVRAPPNPKSFTELRSLLCVVPLFRRLIHDFSLIATQLINFTRTQIFISKWDVECDIAFEKLKEKLVLALILKAPDCSIPFSCHTDASEQAVGGTDTQLGSNGT